MSSRFAPHVGGLALASVIAGCGGSGAAGTFRPSGDTAGQTPAGTPATAPGAGTPVAVDTTALAPTIVARYRRFQQLYEAASGSNNAGPLAEIATDPILTSITQEIEDSRRKGDIWRFHNSINPRLAAITSDGRHAIVLDCLHTLGAFKYDAKTGKQTAAFHKGGYTRYRAVMTLDGGTWKLSQASDQGNRC
ncbi:MAG: hypothetical protein JWO67_5896 [Streptosporangiaceae bacterium]|jgi:hypothetical protein|nr:hypothetical protein [Streptosporangiaceae bacterium]